MIDIPATFSLPPLPEGVFIEDNLRAKGYQILGENWGYHHKHQGPKGLQLIEDIAALPKDAQRTYHANNTILTLTFKDGHTIGAHIHEDHLPFHEKPTLSFFPAVVRGNVKTFGTWLTTQPQYFSPQDITVFWGRQDTPKNKEWYQSAMTLLVTAHYQNYITLPSMSLLLGAYADGPQTLICPSLNPVFSTSTKDIENAEKANLILAAYAQTLSLKKRSTLLAQHIMNGKTAGRNVGQVDIPTQSSHQRMEEAKKWHPLLSRLKTQGII